jgi:hypothetical protein
LLLLEIHLLLLVAILHKLLTALLGRLDAAEKAPREGRARRYLPGVVRGQRLQPGLKKAATRKLVLVFII